MSRPEESKVDRAYALLRERIVSGVVLPGERLVMDRLAVELGLSSVPVREAIRRLEAEGFVEFQRHAGARVAGIDLAGFVGSMEALAVLEAGAMRLAAPKLRAGDLREAWRLHRRMLGWLSKGDQLDPVAFSEANRRFHALLYARCPSARIRALVDAEWDRLAATRRSSFAFVPERAEESVAEHGRLLAALDAGEPPERIEALVREHRMAAAAAPRQALAGRRREESA